MDIPNHQKITPMTFAGGPTYMPPFIKQALRQRLFTSNSILNINSNNKEFEQIVAQARHHLTNILNIPNDHRIWFLGGGCHLQFAGLPLNFLGNNPDATANYTTTGYFSKLSFNQAKRYCKAKSIMDMKTDQKGQFYLSQDYDFDPNAVYTHFIENQSVQGLYYPDNRFPVVQGIPLFNDCSSSFLTRPINWQKVDMAYAHAQKNCGVSGSSIMIINPRSLETNPKSILPQLCSLQNYKSKNGYYGNLNALPVYSNYLMAKYVDENGGLHVNQYEKRAKRLYEVLDKYKIYKPRVRKQFRSPITVTWNIEKADILQLCLDQGAKNQLYEFKGHRSIGGFRASLFCPVPDESVFRLADFLQDFGKKYE